jgi:hypothetical protein
MFNRILANLGSVGAWTVLALGLVLGLGGTALQAEDDDLPLNFDATAINLSNVGPRGSVNRSSWRPIDRWPWSRPGDPRGRGATT